jgi:hypothetical protein
MSENDFIEQRQKLVSLKEEQRLIYFIIYLSFEERKTNKLFCMQFIYFESQNLFPRVFIYIFDEDCGA